MSARERVGKGAANGVSAKPSFFLGQSYAPWMKKWPTTPPVFKPDWHPCNHPPAYRQLFTIQPNPLYSIIILSHPFSIARSLLISCSPTEPYPSLHHVFGMTYHLNFAPFLYLHHRHCQSQHIHIIYPSPLGLPLKIKMSSLQTLLLWPISSFTFSIWNTLTLTATLSPPGILDIGPELPLTPFWKPPFDSSQRSWISWCHGVPGFWVAL